MKVIIIILNWNGLLDTLECLRSLKNLYSPDWSWQTVVVDNGSTDSSVSSIKEAFPEVVILANQNNLGFAQGNNQAINWAKKEEADYCLLLNNDTVVEENFLNNLVKFASREPKTGAVIPLIKYYRSEEIWYAGGRVIYPFWRLESLRQTKSSKPYLTELFSGCAVLIPLKVLEEVGIFDPRYYLYLEDTDLSLRIRKAGYQIWVVPEAVVYHKVSRSSRGNKAPNPIYYQIRNNLLLIQERGTIFERLVGYTYMAVLTKKIFLNLFTQNLPSKKALVHSLTQSWADFIGKKWGKRQ